MEGSFPREQKYIYVVPEIQIDLIFFLKPEFIYKNEAQVHRCESTRPDQTSVRSFELCWLVVT